MQVYSYPSRSEWAHLAQRPALAAQDLDALVAPILSTVRQRGDAALFEYAERFDRVQLASLAVSPEEWAEAETLVSADLRAAIEQAAANIRRFHTAQREQFPAIETMPGVRCWRRSVPISSVGLYIPGGTAPLFSTVLMLAIPAQIAGCQTIILCSPPNAQGKLHPAILYAAKVAGVTQLYKVGGAQAIAAMAYGTETIPQVYKILGPGNQYVTHAKQLIAKEGIAIDMPAGPSEVLVIADDTANPVFVAADLLSQAEHGADSQVILLTTAPDLVPRVQAELQRQLALLPRATTAQQALANSRCLVLDSLEAAFDFSNRYAPEHLILALDTAADWLDRVQNAGSVFLGHYTPESAGDYASGTNHTLPTNGFARAYSGVSLDTFIKKITIQEISRQGLQLLGKTIETMAAAEGLDAHKNAVSYRLD